MIALIILKAIVGVVFAIVCIAVAILLMAWLVMAARQIGHDVMVRFRARRHRSWVGKAGL